MKRRIKWGLLSLILLIGLMIPKISSADNKGTIYYIKSNYMQGAYLYEADGILRYGIPTQGDKSFQWSIEEKASNKTIRNNETGHYITLKGHGDNSVEGNWGEAIQCLPMKDKDDSYLWDFEIDNGQNILSASSSYMGFALHLENAIYGQPFAQKLNGDQLNWGNMKWDFIPESKAEVSGSGSEFCIQNLEDGSYLRVDSGILKAGKPSGPDDSYLWSVELLPDGTKALKNKKTAQYLSMNDFNSASAAPGFEKFKESDKGLSWNFQLSRAMTITTSSDKYKGYGLVISDTVDKQVKSKKLPSGGELKNIYKWNFIPSKDVAEVAGDLVMGDGIYNLKNSYYSLYLIESDGKAIYGNADPADKQAQWSMIYDKASGLTALKNMGSLGYLYAQEESGKLMFSKEIKYYWKLDRNKNSDYPKAVIFQDSINPANYLHMESLNGLAEDSGSVQPTWGTPHWEPIPCNGNTAASGNDDIQTLVKDYMRFFCEEKQGEYLYENTSGAIIYKKCDPMDGRSQWKLLEGDEQGLYYMQNRETGDYIINKGNGTLRAVPKDQIKGEGSFWQFSFRDSKLLINNYNKDVTLYQRPYLNIQKLSGMVQCSLVSAEEKTTQWNYEAAKEASSSTEAKGEDLIPLLLQMDSNLYQLFDNGKELGLDFRLEYRGKYVLIRDPKKNKYLYYEKGWKDKSLKLEADPDLRWELSSKEGVTYLKQGDTKLTAKKVPGVSEYLGKDAYRSGDNLIFSVYVDKAGSYKVGIGYSGKKTTATLKANGIEIKEADLQEKDETELYLNKGINTITLSGVTEVKWIRISSVINHNYRGATLDYVAYQAEDCITTGTVMDESRKYHDIMSEAVGRLGVNLSGTGEYIKITLSEPANSLVIRYCIPDSEDGKGLNKTLNLYIDGKKYDSISMSSEHSWLYGSYPWTNDPADGQPHSFFDEIRIPLNETYPAGTVIKLQKDSDNEAKYYIIDEVDAQDNAPANLQPKNSISITKFGAIPNDGKDDAKALNDCIAEAVKQGKEVWIPAGVFNIDTPTEDYDNGDQKMKNRGILLTLDNVTIRGAGMWHSELTGDYAAFFIKANNIALYDFSLRGTAITRRDAIDPSAIETDYNTSLMKNITIQNLWIEHYKTGIWTHNVDGLHIVGCRIRNTYADGMNLRKGTSNAVIEQCDVRNTGDDAIALWSSEKSDRNVIIRFNTVGLPWLANNIAIYGGTDITVSDNLLYDTVVNGAGINISTNFDPKAFSGLITVERNSLMRCGSEDSNNNQNNGAIWFNTVQGNDNDAKVMVKDNLIMNSSYQGISFSNRGKVSEVTLEGNVMDGCGSYGIDALKNSSGKVCAKNNQITESMLEPVNNSSKEKFQISTEITKVEVKTSAGINPSVVIIITLALVAGLAGVVIYVHRRSKKSRLG